MVSCDIVVRGGSGGTAATLAHLRLARDALRAAAGELDDAAASAGWAHAHGLASFGAPVTAERARAAVDPLVRGPASLGGQADAVRALAAGLDRAADTYEQAEATVDVLMRLLLASAGHQASANPLLAVLVAAVAARAVMPGVLLAAAGLHMTGSGRTATGRLLRTEPTEHAMQLLAGFTRGLAPGRGAPSPVPVVGAAGLVTGSTAGLGLVASPLRRRPLRVTARLDAVRTGPAPRTAADVLTDIGALYPRSGGAAGTVGVDRLDHPDGSRSWVVAIPGTQEATSFGAASNPLDMATNVRLMAGATDDAGELVARALEQAGAGPHEPVLLAGHSQGGMAAMALAGSAAFTARYRVAAVLTAGSPVATHTLPATTAALHLEHRQDLVPALDGWRNPDRPHRTTAVRDLAASPAPVDRLAARSPGSAHEVGAYVRTARAVSATGAASVRDWERAAAQVLGGPGTTAVHREFTGERVAPGTPRRAATGVPLSASGSPR